MAPRTSISALILRLISSRIRQNPRTTQSLTSLALKKRSGRDQIRPKPHIGMNKRIYPKPTPPSSDCNISTMHNYPMDEIRKPTIKITHKPTRHTPKQPENRPE